MVCEKCWGDAYMRSRVNGRTQADNYRELLEERKISRAPKRSKRENECNTI